MKHIPWKLAKRVLACSLPLALLLALAACGSSAPPANTAVPTVAPPAVPSTETPATEQPTQTPAAADGKVLVIVFSATGTTVCGMSMSSSAVPFLYGLLPIHFAQRFHLAMSFWSFVLIVLHLGLHLPALAGRAGMSGRAKRVIVGASVLVAAIGAWLFIKNGIPGYLFFRTPFAMFDYTKSLLRVLLEYLAMLVLFTSVGAACASVTGKRKLN